MREFKTPFNIYESQEYLDRRAAIDQKEKMRNEDGSPVFSTIEIGQMKADLEEWSQTYRWKVDWQGKREQDLWPILRIIRGCSNVLWEKEQEAIRNKKELPPRRPSSYSLTLCQYAFVHRSCLLPLVGHHAEHLPIFVGRQHYRRKASKRWFGQVSYDKSCSRFGSECAKGGYERVYLYY